MTTTQQHVANNLTEKYGIAKLNYDKATGILTADYGYTAFTITADGTVKHVEQVTVTVTDETADGHFAGIIEMGDQAIDFDTMGL